MIDIISQRTEAHLTALNQLIELHGETISLFANRLIDALMQEKKIFCCGLGAHAPNAAAFVARMIDRFDCERPAFPAIALTPGSALVSPFVPGNPEDLLARPLQALANPGDIIVFVVSADHPSLQSAFSTARDLQCQVLILTSESGLRGPDFITSESLLAVPATEPALIHELQLFVLHCCCDLIDNALFGVHDEDNFGS
ncbi:MAG: SIS domain-containing protein [Fluviicoccus sp.]|uniref:D-sedoheptulose-7-phosphate isomerase n=1 Tax=Fluviicoccus sp. TaxID=2003552 RepID=UPI002727428C|nr:SIS domain-containing protein [Fluviicoccus sp.]MDO8329993.1 SIS domain-containing protein [Fluviicoccus sp.]